MTRSSTPFTAALCSGAACGPDPDLPVLEALRGVVRRCPHGVLAVAGCVLGSGICQWRSTGAESGGAVVVVQPCGPDRDPAGHAVAVGPLRVPLEVAELCDWLERGLLSAEDLPARLRPRLPVRRTSLN